MQARQRSGFTLTELIFAMTIFGMLGVGVTSFYIESLTIANTTQQQIRLMGDLRLLSGDMLQNGARAHELIVYASPNADDRADLSKRLTIGTDEDTGDLVCPVGDLAVFVYYELPKPATAPKYRVSRIIAYALERTGDNPGTLSRLTIELSTPSTQTVEEILAAHWSTAPRKLFLRQALPLALADGGGTVPRVFYKRSEQNLAICGQLLHSAGNKSSGDRHTATRTMFFTVTTRS